MTKECKESISRWTEAQAEDIQLNPIIRLHCKSFIQKFCSVNLISISCTFLFSLVTIYYFS